MPPSPPHFPKYTLKVADFLRNPPGDPPLPGKRKGKGKKRNLSLSPNALASSPLFKKTVPSNSSMDTNSQSMDFEDEIGWNPTNEEVDGLLDPSSEASPRSELQISPLTVKGSPDKDVDSPTVAVKAAIEARISEEVAEFGGSASKLAQPASSKPLRTVALPVPSAPLDVPSLDKTNHLAALSSAEAGGVVNPVSGIDSLSLSADSGNKPKDSQNVLILDVAADGTGVNPGSHDAAAGAGSHSRATKKDKGTYADRAKAPASPRELLTNILYVYTSHDRKIPLGQSDWDLVDKQLIRGLLEYPELVRIANSSYDKHHSCGYIACRDKTSEDWVKNCVLSMTGNGGIGFRAWSRDEKPEVKLCRLFLPARFEDLSDSVVLTQLVRYNPFIKDKITLKQTTQEQRGRAIFLEIEPSTYTTIYKMGRKLHFLAMDLDCQLYSGASRPRKVGLGTGIEGVKRLAPATNSEVPPTTNSTKPSTSFKAPLAPAKIKDPRLDKSQQIRERQIQLNLETQRLGEEIRKLGNKESSPGSQTASSASSECGEAKKRKRNRSRKNKKKPERSSEVTIDTPSQAEPKK